MYVSRFHQNLPLQSINLLTQKFCDGSWHYYPHNQVLKHSQSVTSIACIRFTPYVGM